MKLLQLIPMTVLVVFLGVAGGTASAQTATTTPEVATSTATTTESVTATSTATTTPGTATSTDITVGAVLLKQLQEKLNSLRGQIEEIRILIRDRGNAKGIVPGKLISEQAKLLRFERELKIGDKGEDVKLLQKILATDPSIYPGGFVTGNFGPLTQEAVRKLQNKLVIKSDGNLSEETLSKINAILSDLKVDEELIPADLLTNRVKIEIKTNNGNQEVKIQVKPNNGSEDKIEDDKTKKDDKSNDKSKSGKDDDSDDN